MKTLTHFFPKAALGGFLVMALAVIGCDGGDGTGLDEGEMAQYAGTWTGTQFALTAAQNPAMAFDLIGAGGSMVFSIQPNGNFSGTATVPGVLMGVPEMGTITIPLSGVMRLQSETKLRIDFIPEIPPIFTTMDPDVTLSGNTLTLFYDEGTFDFDQDGVNEPSVFQGQMVRN